MNPALLRYLRETWFPTLLICGDSVVIAQWVWGREGYPQIVVAVGIWSFLLTPTIWWKLVADEARRELARGAIAAGLAGALVTVLALIPWPGALLGSAQTLAGAPPIGWSRRLIPFALSAAIPPAIAGALLGMLIVSLRPPKPAPPGRGRNPLPWEGAGRPPRLAEVIGWFLRETWIATVAFVIVSIAINWFVLHGLWVVRIGCCAMLLAAPLWWNFVVRARRHSAWRGAAVGALAGGGAYLIPLTGAILWLQGPAGRAYLARQELGAILNIVFFFMAIACAMGGAVICAVIGALLGRLRRNRRVSGA